MEDGARSGLRRHGYWFGRQYPPFIRFAVLPEMMSVHSVPEGQEAPISQGSTHRRPSVDWTPLQRPLPKDSVAHLPPNTPEVGQLRVQKDTSVPMDPKITPLQNSPGAQSDSCEQGIPALTQ